MARPIKGADSKYRDSIESEDKWMPHIHSDKRHSARAFTPNDGESDGGGFSKLVEESLNGLWDWKPERNARLGENMITFRGVSPGTAEAAANVRATTFEAGILMPVNQALPLTPDPDHSIPASPELQAWLDAGMPLNRGPAGIHVPRETFDNGMDVSYSSNDSYGEFCPE